MLRPEISIVLWIVFGGWVLAFIAIPLWWMARRTFIAFKEIEVDEPELTDKELDLIDRAALIKATNDADSILKEEHNEPT